MCAFTSWACPASHLLGAPCTLQAFSSANDSRPHDSRRDLSLTRCAHYVDSYCRVLKNRFHTDLSLKPQAPPARLIYLQPRHSGCVRTVCRESHLYLTSSCCPRKACAGWGGVLEGGTWGEHRGQAVVQEFFGLLVDCSVHRRIAG